MHGNKTKIPSFFLIIYGCGGRIFGLWWSSRLAEALQDSLVVGHAEYETSLRTDGNIHRFF